MRLTRVRSTTRSLMGMVIVLALVPSAAHSRAPAGRDAVIEESSDPPRTDGARPSLPPRALVRIGTDDLRTQDSITAIAFSPDGRLIAAADANAPSPRVALFDIRTGRRVKQLVSPGKQMGSVECIAFSPNGTRLLWGELGGDVALWDLTNDRLLFREKLHPDQVQDVAFSPDGRLIASAGGDVVRLGVGIGVRGRNWSELVGIGVSLNDAGRHPRG